MKHIFGILLFLIPVLPLYSQNWQPINASFKYNYQIDTADYITNTVWADSVEIIDDDSVFYLNRIMIIDPEDDYYAYKNQGQFLMKQMYKVSDSLYIFSDTLEFRIRPLAHLSESWLFNENEMIYAEVIDERKELIFEQGDSVKIIELTNGKQIKLSKNFGIIEFFDWKSNAVYNLVGIEGDVEYGEQVPNFWDFYNFQAGDTIEMYYYYESIYSDLMFFSNERREKYRVKSIEVEEEKVSINISGLYYSHIYDSGTTYTTSSYFNAIRVFYYCEDCYYPIAPCMTGKYNHELIPLNYYFYLDSYDPFCKDLQMTKKNGLVVKEISGGLPFADKLYSGPFPGSDVLVEKDPGVPINSAKIEFTETLGMTSYYRECLLNGDGSYFENNYLCGYIRNGITFGEVYPNSWYLPSDINDAKKEGVRICPNPANDILFISFIDDVEGKHEIQIYDLTGKIIRTFISEESEVSVDITDFPTGIYLMKAVSKNYIYTSKFIKE